MAAPLHKVFVVDAEELKFTEPEIPIYCPICNIQVPSNELACRSCYNTQQPAPRKRYRQPKPDVNGLFDGVGPIALGRVSE
jgi:hypothetical protein